MPKENDLPESVLTVKKTSKHSQKPDAVYAMIEYLFPNRRYLDVFGREEREGWTVFGNEPNLKLQDRE